MKHNERTMAASRRITESVTFIRARSEYEHHPAHNALEMAHWRKDRTNADPAEFAAAVWYAAEIRLLIGKRYGVTI